MRLPLLAVLIFGSLGAALSESDEDLSRQVIGVWQSPNLGDARDPIYIRDTFKSDYAVTSTYYTQSSGKLTPVRVDVTSAHWMVQKGYVLIGEQRGKELEVSAKRQIHVDAKGEVNRLEDWVRVPESGK